MPAWWRVAADYLWCWLSSLLSVDDYEQAIEMANLFHYFDYFSPVAYMKVTNIKLYS